MRNRARNSRARASPPSTATPASPALLRAASAGALSLHCADTLSLYSGGDSGLSGGALSLLSGRRAHLLRRRPSSSTSAASSRSLSCISRPAVALFLHSGSIVALPLVHLHFCRPAAASGCSHQRPRRGRGPGAGAAPAGAPARGPARRAPPWAQLRREPPLRPPSAGSAAVAGLRRRGSSIPSCCTPAR